MRSCPNPNSVDMYQVVRTVTMVTVDKVGGKPTERWFLLASESDLEA